MNMRAALLFLTTVIALPSQARGTLTGHMRDPSAFGVASVEVHLASGPMGTVTDAHGTFRVRQF
jgi:hypothetical protein